MVRSGHKDSSVTRGKSSTQQKSFDLNHRSDKKSKPTNYQLVFNQKTESLMMENLKTVESKLKEKMSKALS